MMLKVEASWVVFWVDIGVSLKKLSGLLEHNRLLYPEFHNYGLLGFQLSSLKNVLTGVTCDNCGTVCSPLSQNTAQQ